MRLDLFCLLLLLLAGCRPHDKRPNAAGPPPVDCAHAVWADPTRVKPEPKRRTIADLKLGETAAFCCLLLTENGQAYITEDNTLIEAIDTERYKEFDVITKMLPEGDNIYGEPRTPYCVRVVGEPRKPASYIPMAAVRVKIEQRHP